MRTILVTLTVFLAFWMQLPALAGPHEDGIAAGHAANAFTRSTVDHTSAANVVPGYTAMPPERAYYGQPNLAGQANARLAHCALTPGDPVCDAQLGAIHSANTPRDAVTAYDPGVAPAKEIARNPSIALGSLAAYYAGCSTTDVATSATTQPRLCRRYAGANTYQCTRSLTVGSTRSANCTPGDWFAHAGAGNAGFDVQCLPERPDTAQHFRITQSGDPAAFFDADLTVPRPFPQRVADLGPDGNAGMAGTLAHLWVWLAGNACTSTTCTATALIAPDRHTVCTGASDAGSACTTIEPFNPIFAACPPGQQHGGVIRRASETGEAGPMPAATPIVIDYYGDSTVWGYASGSGGQVALPAPAVFAAALPAATQFDVRNEGVNGSTACELLRGADGRHPPWEAQMAASNASFVIINHAINDQWKDSLADYSACLAQLAQIAKLNGKQVIFETPNPTRDSGVGGLDVIVQAMRDVASREQVPVIDQYAYLTRYLAGQSPTTIAPDGLHPTDAVYEMKGKYAAEIFAGLFPNPSGSASPTATLDASRCYLPSPTPTAIAGSDMTGAYSAAYWTLAGSRTVTGWQRNPAFPLPISEMTLSYAKPTVQATEQDRWEDQCAELAAGGRCVLASADVCVDGPSTKRIDGRDVTRSCWRYERTFSCNDGTPINECAPLAASGCTPVASACQQLNAATGVCDVFQDTYQCPVLAQTTTSASNCPSNVFCLGASCFNTAYTNDTDFARAMSLMEAAREAGVYLDTDRMQVFKGERNRCRERLLTNCCDTDNAGASMTNRSMFGMGSRLVYDVLMNSDNRQFLHQGIQALLSDAGFNGSFSAYGVTVAVNGTALPAGSVTLFAGDSIAVAFDPWSLAITVVMYVISSATSCDAEEGKLAMKEGARLCHSVGSYCSSCLRILGRCVSCITHTTSKCCFNSVLSRIVNEQGRVQVGKGWGSAEDPDCSGFTVAQLQSLDFAAMDLTEFYASIVPDMPDMGAIRAAGATRVAQFVTDPRQMRPTTPPQVGTPAPPAGPTPAPTPPQMPGPPPSPPPTNANVSPFGQDASLYTSTFAEEFENGLDAGLWNDTIWYEASNPTKNYTVENGVLKIWPERDASGRFFNRTIDTDGRYTQTYGYFEIEAKLPLGKGTWPAFWLFNHIGERRPEIDVMEAYAGGAAPWGFTDGAGVAHPQAYAPTVWKGDYEGQLVGSRQYDTGMDLSAGFHKYAVKWEPNKQTFYFDGQEVLTLNVTMSDPMYLMLDLWYGSASGEPDGSTPTGKANSYEINYVRAWSFK
ncbi:type-F conjugative transfer system mating-pair stabilization protein TraN [Noviherbaspirillum sp. ST9]|uniref:type-F conjugative transfer system mating-pair stabilization protein TraN n=1 Tax=Noviherbaspirillum sp. ST9 TaxID=3401606 RepID=UPI003B587E9A